MISIAPQGGISKQGRKPMKAMKAKNKKTATDLKKAKKLPPVRPLAIDAYIMISSIPGPSMR